MKQLSGSERKQHLALQSKDETTCRSELNIHNPESGLGSTTRDVWEDGGGGAEDEQPETSSALRCTWAELTADEAYSPEEGDDLLHDVSAEGDDHKQLLNDKEAHTQRVSSWPEVTAGGAAQDNLCVTVWWYTAARLPTVYWRPSVSGDAGAQGKEKAWVTHQQHRGSGCRGGVCEESKVMCHCCKRGGGVESRLLSSLSHWDGAWENRTAAILAASWGRGKAGGVISHIAHNS